MRCAVLVSLSYLLAGSMPAGAETVVSFVHPEQFTDASLQWWLWTEGGTARSVRDCSIP